MAITLTEDEAETAARALATYLVDTLCSNDRRTDEKEFLDDCYDLLWRVDADRAEQFLNRLPGWERPVGGGLEHVPPDQLYDARTAQLKRETERRTGARRRNT